MNILNEFDETTKAQWQAQSTKDLKGLAFETLIWKTNTGIELEPYYTKEDAENENQSIDIKQFINKEKNNNDWQIIEKIILDDTNHTPQQLNEKTLNALMNGATALYFVGDFADENHFNTIFSGIEPQYIHLYFSTSQPEDTLNHLVDFLTQNDIDPTKIKGNLGVQIPNDASEVFYENTSVCLCNINQNLPQFGLINIAIKNHNNAIEDLKLALKLGNEALHKLTEQEAWTIDELSQKMMFTFELSDDFYLELGKLRAFRVLWANVLSRYKATNLTSTLVATTNTDPTTQNTETNMVRNTTQAMAAALASVDGLIVANFKGSINQTFENRIARNTQLILKHESFLDQKIDPTNGSHYIEHLTHELVAQSWAMFVKS